MWRRFRPPLLAIAIVLLGLIALLATLQYRWLGQVSQAERERLQATLSTGASEFAQDFDRELTRAYLLFQMEPGTDDAMSARAAERYDQWQATARFPRLLKDYYVFIHDPSATPILRRFNPATRRLEAAEWPNAMADWRAHLIEREITETELNAKTVFVARMSQPIWEAVPAIVAPMPVPLVLLPEPPRSERITALFSYAILTLDLDYLRADLFPALAGRHFSRGGSEPDFQVAVVRTAGSGELVYSSSHSFAPKPDATADATASLFQVRTQDFSSIAAEVRRFTTFAASVRTKAGVGGAGSGPGEPHSRDVMTLHEGRPLSIFVQSTNGPALTSARGITTTRVRPSAGDGWKLVLRHPSGSLEAAVSRLRRRNLIVSTSVLGVLGASMGLLVLATRRAQRLARQQMEFVAAVSHELRTPLAVLRSAADNLADGVIQDEEQIRKYGELMRSEGRRLTAMVEQILELAGIQSGQRGFALRALAIGPLLDDIVSSSAPLIEDAGIEVESSIPPDLPPVLGDEPALRRVFQNLVDNAIKYGARGRWLGLSAATRGSVVRITVADRGMGIPLDEQARIFDPFYRAGAAISTRIQGAGLGLSLVQRIVEAHGGRVIVGSTPATGSEFIVELPAAVAWVASRLSESHPSGAEAPRSAQT